MRSAAYTSGRPTHGDPAPAVCLSDPLEAAPNEQICTTTGPAQHDSSAVQNGGYVRVQEDAFHLSIGTVMRASGCMDMHDHPATQHPQLPLGGRCQVCVRCSALVPGAGI